MRYWLWGRAKMAVALVLIGTLGATPAWLVDRWIVRLDPTAYLLVALGGIWALLAWTDFNGLAQRWKAGEGRVGAAPSTRRD